VTRCTHPVTSKNSATPAISAPWIILAIRMRPSGVTGLVIDPSVSGRHITSDPNHDHK